jgi:outer membrane protein OmpA-like peptidoglycan-associated protein
MTGLAQRFRETLTRRRHRPAVAAGADGRSMRRNITRGVSRQLALAPRLAGVLALAVACGSRADTAPPVVDSQSIVRSLGSSGVATRGLVVAERPAASGHRIALDVPFKNGSAQITAAANRQLDELGTALEAAELGGVRFLIAGHTSATGSPAFNQRLSEARARSVRDYLLHHYPIEPDRLKAAGFGSSRPLPGMPPDADRQRRVEISTLPAL